MAQAIHLHEAIAFSGSFPLLAGVDLEVEVGEIVHLKGSNGAGKTSLLRALAGLLPIAQGAIAVLGYDLRIDRRSVRSEVGLVGHQTFLYEDLDARSNISFWLRGTRGAMRVDESLRRVGLHDRLSSTPVALLSTGQRRRVALALLFARSPRLWLLDEPHAGLDVDGRALVDGLIVDAAHLGTTVLLSSHELEYVRSLAVRSVTMAGGRIVANAPSSGGDTCHDA
jgi:heme ABC exporter ATP-binding subunit CcmA